MITATSNVASPSASEVRGSATLNRIYVKPPFFLCCPACGNSDLDVSMGISSRHHLAAEFARGVDDVIPGPSVVAMVDRLIRLVEAKTANLVRSVDEEDGSFSFEGWLPDGLFIMCEIAQDGEINAGLYRSPTGPQERFLANLTEQELESLY